LYKAKFPVYAEAILNTYVPGEHTVEFLNIIKNNNWIVPIKLNLICSLIIINLTTCFDPIESSSDLHYETVNVRELHTLLESKQCTQLSNINWFIKKV
jgi:hypothetical protein